MPIANDNTEAPYTPWCVYKDGFVYFMADQQQACLAYLAREFPRMTAAQAAIWGFTIEHYRKAAA